MMNAFYLGGWGMYPTLLFGILALGTGVWHAVSPERRRLLLLGILSLLTLFAGTLGTVVGIMNSLRYAAGQENQVSLMAQGTFESLNCVALGLILIILSGLVGAVGVFRGSSGGGDASRVPANADA